MLNLEEVLLNVKKVIKEVGKYQLDNFQRTLDVDTKSTENDLVTNVDKSSEEKIIRFIKEKYPDHDILSEEGGGLTNNSNYRWVIDPLDGTNNFAHGFPIFTVSIALEYDSRVVLGCVYYPVQDELFFAVEGGGSYLNENKINVSKAESISHAILVTGFPYDKAESNDNNLDHINRILPLIRGLRRTGSAAYDLCNVARGSFDGYWELKLNLWDIAAGKLIVEEAGGKVVYITTNDNIRLVAGNLPLVEDLLDELKKENDYWDISL
ncbi:MAG: inositol monophosphatase family protein [Halanaerobiaceae bacterium]